MAKALMCPGHRAADFPDEPGCWAGPSFPTAAASVQESCFTEQCGRGAWCVHCLQNGCPLSYPLCLLAHWRYQKFQIFKAVSVFSVYMLNLLMVHGQKWFSTSHTQTLVRFLFLASLCFVGPTLTAILKYSVQPYHGRTPHLCQYRG